MSESWRKATKSAAVSALRHNDLQETPPRILGSEVYIDTIGTAPRFSASMLSLIHRCEALLAALDCQYLPYGLARVLGSLLGRDSLSCSLLTP